MKGDGGQLIRLVVRHVADSEPAASQVEVRP